MPTQYCYCWVDDATGEIVHMRSCNVPLDPGRGYIEPDDTTGLSEVEFEIESDLPFDNFGGGQQLISAADLRANIRVTAGAPEFKPGNPANRDRITRVGPAESCRSDAVRGRLLEQMKARLGVDDAEIDNRVQQRGTKYRAEVFDELKITDVIRMAREVDAGGTGTGRAPGRRARIIAR